MAKRARVITPIAKRCFSGEADCYFPSDYYPLRFICGYAREPSAMEQLSEVLSPRSCYLCTREELDLHACQLLSTDFDVPSKICGSEESTVRSFTK